MKDTKLIPAQDVGTGAVLGDLPDDLELLGQMLGEIGGDRKSGKLCITAADRIRKLTDALRELVAAEDASIDQFTAKEIDRIERAMKRANALLSPNNQAEEQR